MAITTSEIINSVNLNAGTNFPYLVLDVVDDNSYPRNPGFQTVHWHEDIQFIYVFSGNIAVKTLSETVPLAAGEGCFINKNVVHLVEKQENCHYNSFIFPDHFLKFYFGSPAESIISRIVGQDALPIYKFSEETPWQKDVLRCLKRLSAFEKDKDNLYPYRVLCTLCSMWLVLQSNLVLPVSPKENMANARMKLFLRYIHDHFTKHISLADIAKSANVSESETLRCFKLCMQTTPYRYLLELRLERAAKLLRETDEPVTNIADMVGFSQVSYFGKCFKTKTGRSPKEYREKCNSKF